MIDRMQGMLLRAVTALTWAVKRKRGGMMLANGVAEGEHDSSRTYLSSAAITTKNLLYKQGSSGAEYIEKCDASSIPLGTVDDLCAAADTYVTVKLLGKGPTKKMVAAGAISAGAAVYAAANGKVASSGTYAVGVALTAASGDGDEIEVADCHPSTSTGMLATLFTNANQVLISNGAANSAVALDVPASNIVGRSASGGLTALTPAQVLTVLGMAKKTLAAGTFTATSTSTTQTMTATGATTGDVVVATVHTPNTSEYVTRAYVSASDTVTFVLSDAPAVTTKINYAVLQ